MNRTSWIFCLVISTVSIVLSYHLSTYVQEMSEVLRSGGMALPKITIFYLTASENWLSDVGYFVVILIVLKEVFIKSLRTRSLLNILFFLSVVAFFALGYWAMNLPNGNSII
jgi:hypothetical protein